MGVNRHLPWDGWRVWNRAVDPVALGIGLAMATLLVYNVTDRGILGPHMLGDVVAALCGAALVNLIAGWFTQHRTILAVGFLVAFIAYLLRGTAVLLLAGPAAEGVWLSTSGAIICGGSFLLTWWGDGGS